VAIYKKAPLDFMPSGIASTQARGISHQQNPKKFTCGLLKRKAADGQSIRRFLRR
jgi:hypothetical protein